MSIEIKDGEKDFSKEEFDSLNKKEKECFWYNYFSTQIRAYCEFTDGEIDNAISRKMYIECRTIDPDVKYYLAEIISEYKLDKIKIFTKGIFLPVILSIFP